MRQIEAGAIKDLRGFIKSGILNEFLKTVNEHIKNMEEPGGSLAFSRPPASFKNLLRFLTARSNFY